MKNVVSTGSKCKISGQYRAIGSKTEITMIEGHKVPPTNSGNTKFVLVDKTKHKQ